MDILGRGKNHLDRIPLGNWGEKMGKKEYLVISSPIGALKGYNNGKLSVVCFRNQERIRKHTVLVNNKTRTFYIILYLCITYIVYYIVIIFIYPSTLHACIYISQ